MRNKLTATNFIIYVASTFLGALSFNDLNSLYFKFICSFKEKDQVSKIHTIQKLIYKNFNLRNFKYRSPTRGTGIPIVDRGNFPRFQ